MLDQAGFTRTGREISLHAPLTEADVRALEVGDVVLISGRMFTGRDAVHSHLMKHEPPVDLRGSVLYHCGPSSRITTIHFFSANRAVSAFIVVR
jgi:fumarate hydratase class I